MNLLYILKKNRKCLQCTTCNVVTEGKYIDCGSECDKDCYNALARNIICENMKKI